MIAPDQDVADLRSAPRYIVSPPVTGSFGSAAVSMIDLSTLGMQVQHSEPLRLGSQARISFMVTPSTRVSWRGTVVWSRLSKQPDSQGKHPYFSGIRVDEEREEIEAALEKLRQLGQVYPETGSIERKRRALREKAKARAAQLAVKTVNVRANDIPTDQLLMIQHARERLQTNPDEAKKWYARAKFAHGEDQTKLGSLMHYRDDVLAVWEYLERTIDLDKILKVFEEHRK